MSVKSFAEAVKENITRYTRAFGIEQAEAEEAEFIAFIKSYNELLEACKKIGLTS